jgi:hypothetical protein
MLHEGAHIRRRPNRSKVMRDEHVRRGLLRHESGLLPIKVGLLQGWCAMLYGRRSMLQGRHVLPCGKTDVRPHAKQGANLRYAERRKGLLDSL